jgi:hypothetical protein
MPESQIAEMHAASGSPAAIGRPWAAGAHHIGAGP